MDLPGLPVALDTWEMSLLAIIVTSPAPAQRADGVARNVNTTFAPLVPQPEVHFPCAKTTMVLLGAPILPNTWEVSTLAIIAESHISARLAAGVAETANTISVPTADLLLNPMAPAKKAMN